MSLTLLERQTTTNSPRHIDFRTVGVGETIGSLSFDPNEAVRLKQLDVDHMREEFARNLEGFKGEVLDDIPVSHKYHYYFDGQGNVFSHSDRLPIHRFENQFDPRERDGMPEQGFRKATQLLRGNPDTTVLWYSPPGAATLDADPSNPYANVTFIYGQLYVMNYDGEKINGVAVKVDRDGEAAIKQLMPDVFHEAERSSTDYDRLSWFLQNPAMLAGDIGAITHHAWSDGVIYSGKENSVARKNFTVSQLMIDLRQRFDGAPNPQNEFDELVNNLRPEQLTDRAELAKVYLRLIMNHSTMQQDGKISLKGACGGSTVTSSDIEALLGRTQIEPLTSSYRFLTQSDWAGALMKGLPSATTESQHFTCPNCNHQADGPVGNQCPSCSITREQWAEKGNQVC